MPAPKVRAHYDQLARIAAAFDRQAGETQRLAANLTRQVQVLESGDWAGRGAKAFYREMDSQVPPSLRRLASAPNAVLAALKTLAKQIPPGAARDSLQEMVELAAMMRSCSSGSMGTTGSEF